MKKKMFFLILPLLIIACNTTNDNHKTWVYVELTYVFRNDTVSDALFGKMKNNDLEIFKANKSDKRTFELSEARYIAENDSIKDFSKTNETGTFFYRFKNIIYLEIKKDDPLKNAKLELNK